MFSKSSKRPSAGLPTVATGARHPRFSIIDGDVAGKIEASARIAGGVTYETISIATA